ncbi:sulfide quinone-reductase [Cordyceps fumosorosea ARSEF 2679]|uniref:Sulfide quinone-reductase n=1 Tax=Cordyceps fumosorosea (strain ARSEF 2679) TaxID=1081104 RepID=A0A167ZKG6_CORFA|nr:sulfide quinone-reductase [Cordyceps fumosorosea ARSEF 2679]OAA67624.1 sulfide quinone-reductase [Cordyceps fumosorosea ARSEF 2679]
MRARSAGTALSRAGTAVSPRVLAAPHIRTLATTATTPVTGSSRSHKVVVVGGGAAGASVSHQLLRSGRYSRDDIAVVDPARWHHYQPGWTLVGGGVKDKEDLRMRMTEVLDPRLAHYDQPVQGFLPDDNAVKLASGARLQYEQLVVCPGIDIYYDKIKGLPEALADPAAPVSTVYGYEGADKVFRTVEALRSGKALFTQPAGMIKCAGAPQKVMWLALDHWRRAGLYNKAGGGVDVTFATALPAMFGVPKYSAALEALRVERGVEGLFQHDLVEVDGDRAIFSVTDAASGSTKTVTRRFDLLHAVPKMGPHAFVARSPLADAAGLVDVHRTPTAKTAAAVTAQAPVVVANLLAVAEGGEPAAEYDGYTSCPLTTERGKVLLAEFMYGGQPKETFAAFGVDQAEPNRAFWHLKKDFFPWVYKNYMVKGTWGGPKGFL